MLHVACELINALVDGVHALCDLLHLVPKVFCGNVEVATKVGSSNAHFLAQLCRDDIDVLPRFDVFLAQFSDGLIEALTRFDVFFPQLSGDHVEMLPRLDVLLAQFSDDLIEAAMRFRARLFDQLLEIFIHR